ncbi:hypothetical protein R1flu_024218 [Riccia fluitans]|uniref:glutathione transferase n=1 Tax=Riccia fluitans TaxID=41844 RepID=A0ABD1XX65_9MARC
MTIKIYGSSQFTSTGRVLITLFEKHIEDFEIVDIDLFKGEHRTPEFLISQKVEQLQGDDALVATSTVKLGVVLDVYEKRLGETEYLAGDFFSLADLSHITFAWFLIHLAHHSALFNSRPHVKAWIDKLFSRPSTQKWLKLAGLVS